MTQAEKRRFLIETLLKEQPKYFKVEIPTAENEQKMLLRALFNVRMPKPVSAEFLAVQDEYLQQEIKCMGITDFADLPCVQNGIYLWRGDITTLKCGAVVNAANSEMLGCFYPNHACIDNAIHTYAGVELRLECAEIMKAQKTAEPQGRAKITKAYNLPCKYILHTVGPVVRGHVTKADKKLLAGCYSSCLKLADEYGIESIAFCCISTGEFHFPNALAAKIAIKTVKEYKAATNSEIKVIFNVFKQTDYDIYNELLSSN
ncbi:MAG: protein-ADP-ribose hydrolase [Clostridiales bacterium]|nr:protein-ADP-ribose hydrolase [Clostridiales bacterium]